MKVQVKQPESEKSFPKLMMGTTTNAIVLFRLPKHGVVIYQGKGDYYTIGMDSNTWDMDYFTDFKGSVTISND